MCADAVAQKQDCCSFTQHILKENNFACVRYWINELTGRHIEEFERFTIQSRLAPCAERTGFANVNRYVEFLGDQTSDFTLPCWQVLIDAVLETDTWFRRESKQFNFLRQILLPTLPENAAFLSAGCGEGEEAFDIAFECAEYFGLTSNWHIDAIDIRAEAIDNARLGQWEDVNCTTLPSQFLDSYFEKHQYANQIHGVKVVPKIREKVTFICQNLLHLNEDRKYNVIFCRNVLLDMEKSIAKIIIAKMMNALLPEGVLIVSYNENLEEFVNPDLLISPTIARKM